MIIQWEFFQPKLKLPKSNNSTGLFHRKNVLTKKRLHFSHFQEFQPSIYESTRIFASCFVSGLYCTTLHFLEQCQCKQKFAFFINFHSFQLLNDECFKLNEICEIFRQHYLALLKSVVQPKSIALLEEVQDDGIS